MNFVSLASFLDMCWALIDKIPNKYDLIIAIPRSGAIPGAMMATRWGIPMTTPEAFPYQYCGNTFGPRKVNRVLLVDDTYATGRSMGNAIKTLGEKGLPGYQIDTCSVICRQDSGNKLNYFQTIIEPPRMFEWNIAHGKWGKVACDIDGVLCMDPPLRVNEYGDEKGYIDWIRNAQPRIIPTYTLDVVVSCRLEKYRFYTEDWLAKNHIKWKHLELWNLNDPRARAGKHGEFKVQAIGKHRVEYAIESDENQAMDIHHGLGVPVLCTDTMFLWGGVNW